jgi:hypothetical protein
VCDNLNPHSLAALYRAFEPVEALRLAQKRELVHTPKHSSRLNVTEAELSVLTRQCLRYPLAGQDIVAVQAAAWSK